MNVCGIAGAHTHDGIAWFSARNGTGFFAALRTNVGRGMLILV